VTPLELDEIEVKTRVLVVKRGLEEELVIVVKFNFKLVCEKVKVEEMSLIEEEYVVKFAPNVWEVSDEDELVDETGDDTFDEVL